MSGENLEGDSTIKSVFFYELIWFISPNACRALSLFLNGPDPDTIRKWIHFAGAFPMAYIVDVLPK